MFAPMRGVARWLSLLFILILTPLITPPARADGGAFKRLIEDPTAANMPDQAALITFANNTETLAIQTHFAGKPGDFAWVVPLPSVPTVTAVSTGVFKTLPAIFPRRLISQLDSSWQPAIVISVIICGLCLLTLLKSSSGATITLAVALILSGGVCLLPTLGRARSAASPPLDTVHILNREIVGCYELATLSSKDPTELIKWLNSHDFNVPASSATAIAAYVKDGWCFLAAKARQPTTTFSLEEISPHPLAFTFQTPKPVYPMRLTGAGNTGPLTVDLYIFGSGSAKADGWTERMSAPIAILPAKDIGHDTSRDLTLYGQVNVSHPGIRDLIGTSAHATHLRATLSPQQMDHDVTISFDAPHQSQQVVWSREAAGGRAIAIGFITLAALFLTSVAITFKKPLPTRLHYFGGSFLIALLALFFSFPFTPISTATISRYSVSPHNVLLETAYEIGELNKAKKPVNEITIEKILKDALAENHFPIENLKREDSPGNYTLEKIGELWYLKFYDLQGQENVITF